MASASTTIVFTDQFTIDGIDKEGKKFDRVSRLYSKSRGFDMDMQLDYNIELFPLKAGQSFTMALASSLQRGGPTAGEDGEKEKDIWRPDGKGRGGLEDDYDYVMYGRVYKFDGGNSDIVTVYASFGGLLMAMTGSYRHMSSIVLGEPIYILLRK